MIFISAVPEGEFGLHLYACKDVSVLFSSNFKKINWSLTELYISVFTDDKKLISINKSVGLSHHNVTPTLIALHVLSGYKSVPMMFGTGKSKI